MVIRSLAQFIVIWNIIHNTHDNMGNGFRIGGNGASLLANQHYPFPFTIVYTVPCIYNVLL